MIIYPTELCKNPIKATSREDDLVLDPFMGSATTGEVSLRLKRKFVGYELNQKFAELSCIRLNNVVDELDKSLTKCPY